MRLPVEGEVELFDGDKLQRLPVEGEVELFNGDKLHLCPVAGQLNDGGLGGWTPYD